MPPKTDMVSFELNVQNRAHRETHIKEEEYFVFSNGCFIVGDAFTLEKEAADKRNHRTHPWRDIASAPREGRAIDLWINGYRVTNCQWDEIQKKWTEDWLDAEEKYQSFAVIWAPPTYWLPIRKGSLFSKKAVFSI
jgi:hypothetical protein